MEDWKKEYDNIKVPEEMREKLEQSINRAKKEKKRMKKNKGLKMNVGCSYPYGMTASNNLL